MSPQDLSLLLRTGQGLYLWCRRGIVALAFVAGACMQMIGLYQMGLIRHLPDPPVPHLDAEKVDASAEAYSPLGLPMPDAFLGLISYAITAALAALGGDDRAERRPWLPLLMGIKIFVDAAQAGRLTWDQWAKHQAFCLWCLIAAGATFLAVPLALPESYAGLKRLLGAITGR